MSEEQLKELQEYNLEYLEAQASEEMFGGDFTSVVELKQAKREIERLNNIINELEKWLNDRQNSSVFYEEYENVDVYGIVLDKLQELKGEDKE